MGKIIDEYMDIKLQQECVSKTIDTLWKMAQKYQKIVDILNSTSYVENNTTYSYTYDDETRLKHIREVVTELN